MMKSKQTRYVKVTELRDYNRCGLSKEYFAAIRTNVAKIPKVSVQNVNSNSMLTNNKINTHKLKDENTKTSLQKKINEKISEVKRKMRI